MEKIEPGFDVFLHDGAKAFGAVRDVAPHGRAEIVIYVEDAGDFVVPLSAVKDAHSEKVILDAAKLESRLRDAIAHAHRDEDPTI
jgi:hypothetical protein